MGTKGTASGGSSPPPLAVAGISKHFGAVRALQDVSFDVGHQQVVALLGKNGSGKSTLIKILAGYHEADAGEICLEGVSFGRSVRPAEIRAHGLSFVHQDLALFGALSVTENMLAAKRVLPSGMERCRIAMRAEAEEVSEILTRYGLQAIDPRQRVADLTAGERALLAIVRAAEGISDRKMGGLLVLDEPTAFLGRSDTERLFALLAQLVASGKSAMLVTHNVREVREVADRVVILRDGALVADELLDSLSDDEVVSHIVGGVPASGDRSRDRSRRAGKPSSVALEAAGISGPGVTDVSLSLRSGEVVGVAGLVGSGADVLPKALFGACEGFRGDLRIGSTSYSLRRLTPHRSIATGIALVPGNRMEEGLAPGLTLADNLSLPVLGSFFRRLVLRLRSLGRRAEALCAAFDVKTQDAAALASDLSGGNQQKVLIAKWMAEHPAVLLLDEPTQGVDVGARESLYELIDGGVGEGAAVLWHSSDMEELAANCDRVLIMSGGRVVTELAGDSVTEVALQGALTGARSPGSQDGRGV